ncbi:hypothetical protein ACFLVR_03510 [Chloroflexota bacterium]
MVPSTNQGKPLQLRPKSGINISSVHSNWETLRAWHNITAQQAKAFLEKYYPR